MKIGQSKLYNQNREGKKLNKINKQILRDLWEIFKKPIYKSNEVQKNKEKEVGRKIHWKK